MPLFSESRNFEHRLVVDLCRHAAWEASTLAASYLLPPLHMLCVLRLVYGWMLQQRGGPIFLSEGGISQGGYELVAVSLRGGPVL